MAAMLLVGLGDLGGRIATCALAAGAGAENIVYAMRRSAQSLPGVTLIQHDATQPWPKIANSFTDLVLCVAPNDRSDDAYRQAYLKIAEQALHWLQPQTQPPHVWLVSSTSVYGQHQGEWIDEDSPRQPDASTAKILVTAEDLWFNNGLPCTILRPAGLYGPGREMMLRIAKTGQQIIENQPVYTNRIEISDCARAIVHLIKRRQQGLTIANAYNLSDLNPARYADVVHFLQQQLQIPAGPSLIVNRGSKRVSASRLQQTGFSWHYPDYRAGYQQML